MSDGSFDDFLESFRAVLSNLRSETKEEIKRRSDALKAQVESKNGSKAELAASQLALKFKSSDEEVEKMIILSLAEYHKWLMQNFDVSTKYR